MAGHKAKHAQDAHLQEWTAVQSLTYDGEGWQAAQRSISPVPEAGAAQALLEGRQRAKDIRRCSPQQRPYMPRLADLWLPWLQHRQVLGCDVGQTCAS